MKHHRPVATTGQTQRDAGLRIRHALTTNMSDRVICHMKLAVGCRFRSDLAGHLCATFEACMTCSRCRGQVSYDNYAAWCAALRRVTQSNIRAPPASTSKIDMAAENAAAEATEIRCPLTDPGDRDRGRFGAELAPESPSWRRITCSRASWKFASPASYAHPT